MGLRWNGTNIPLKVVIPVVLGILTLATFLWKGGMWAAEVKSGLENHGTRLTKLESKQEAIWEMVRTQHVHDSLVAIAKKDPLFTKAMDIVKNGNHDQPDTLGTNEYSTDDINR